MPRRYRTRPMRPGVTVPAWVLNFLATGVVDYDDAGLDPWAGEWSGTHDLQPLTPQLHPSVSQSYLEAWARFRGVFECHRAEVEALCAPGKRAWFERQLAKVRLPGTSVAFAKGGTACRK